MKENEYILSPSKKQGGAVRCIVAFLFFSVMLSSLAAAWWNPAWSYRMPVNVTEAAGTSINYWPVNFDINTQALVSGGKMRSDCNDLRVILNDVEIPRQIGNSTCNTAATKIYVQVNTTANQKTNLYVYYGNPSASAPSYSTDLAWDSSGKTLASSLMRLNWATNNNYISVFEYNESGSWYVYNVLPDNFYYVISGTTYYPHKTAGVGTFTVYENGPVCMKIGEYKSTGDGKTWYTNYTLCAHNDWVNVSTFWGGTASSSLTSVYIPYSTWSGCTGSVLGQSTCDAYNWAYVRQSTGAFQAETDVPAAADDAGSKANGFAKYWTYVVSKTGTRRYEIKVFDTGSNIADNLQTQIVGDLYNFLTGRKSWFPTPNSGGTFSTDAVGFRYMYTYRVGIGLTDVQAWAFANITKTQPSYASGSEEPCNVPVPVLLGANDSSPAVGDPVIFYSQWAVNGTLDKYIFGWNASGAGCDTWANDSAQSFQAGNWTNTTKTIPAACVGKTVGYRFYANDTTGNNASTAIGTVQAEAIFSVSNQAPADLTSSLNTTYTFGFMVGGSQSTYSCELLINNTGYGKNASTANNTPALIQNNASLSPGTYSWRVDCTSSATTNSSADWQLTVIAPQFSVSNQAPANGATQETGRPTFWFIASGNSPTYSCLLDINGASYGATAALNNTNTSISNSPGLVQGDYAWKINCTVGGTTVSSPPYSLTINTSANITTYQTNAEYYGKWKKYGAAQGHGVFAADVDGDNITEILLAGWDDNGSQFFATVNISSWNGSAITNEYSSVWYDQGPTTNDAIYAADVDNDGQVEILTVGRAWYNSMGWAYLNISRWDGTTMTVESYSRWRCGGDSWANSVYAKDVDNDGVVEIVIGGWGYDGVTGDNAFLRIVNWNGAALTLEHFSYWRQYENTWGRSVYAADVDADGKTEILATGYVPGADLINYAFTNITYWSGSTMTIEKVAKARHENGEYGYSVYATDVDGDGNTEIITTGMSNDLNRERMFLNVSRWNGSDVTTEYYEVWYDSRYIYGNTYSTSVYAKDIDGDGVKEIMFTGVALDGTRDNAFLNISTWDGTAAGYENSDEWWDGAASWGLGVYAADIDGDNATEVLLTGLANGYHFLKIITPTFRTLNVPGGITMKAANGSNLSAVGEPMGEKTAYVEAGANRVAALTIDFSGGDMNFSSLVANSSASEKKAFVHMIAWPWQVNANKTLYIPGTGRGWIRICPGARTFGEVNLTCTGGFDQDASASWNGTHYAVNVTGSGGMETPDLLPNVTFNAPEDGNTSTSLTVQFNFTPVDDGGFSNCSLWLNSTGSWAYNASNQSAISNNSVNTITLTFADNGTYTWNIQCCDNASQCTFAAANRTLIVNYTAIPTPPSGGEVGRGAYAAPESPLAITMIFVIAVALLALVAARQGGTKYG
jgi:hypothetical protein